MTDLNSAFSLLSNVSNLSNVPNPDEHLPSKQVAGASKSHSQQYTPSINTRITNPIQSPTNNVGNMQQMAQSLPQQQQGALAYDPSTVFKQLEAERQMQYMMQQKLAHQKHMQSQQQQMQWQAQKQDGYISRLLGKKRDVLKMIIFAMMILLAISIHTFVDYWMKDFATAYQLSYKQELGLRAAYPILVVFILWNLKLVTMR
jgi:hypothetical protein